MFLHDPLVREVVPDFLACTLSGPFALTSVTPFLVYAPHIISRRMGALCGKESHFTDAAVGPGHVLGSTTTTGGGTGASGNAATPARNTASSAPHAQQQPGPAQQRSPDDAARREQMLRAAEERSKAVSAMRDMILRTWEHGD